MFLLSSRKFIRSAQKYVSQLTKPRRTQCYFPTQLSRYHKTSVESKKWHRVITGHTKNTFVEGSLLLAPSANFFRSEKFSRSRFYECLVHSLEYGGFWPLDETCRATGKALISKRPVVECTSSFRPLKEAYSTLLEWPNLLTIEATDAQMMSYKW